jgi:fatty acid hydroxylase family protein/histidine kinase/DNA gyrase B/HSP90-like ATPase
MLPSMWRFHRIHHSDPFAHVTTTYRTHPVETLRRFLFAIVPVWVLGVPASAVVIQRLLQATNGILEHANVRLWEALDRFYRVDEGRSRAGGAGLGLAIARWAVGVHGGRISLDNAAGRGSVFRIVLPQERTRT